MSVLAADPALAPLPRRLLRVAALLALLLVAVLANSLLHGDGNPADPLAVAAQQTRQAGGGKIGLTIVYSSPDGNRTATVRGDGVYNDRTDRSRIALTVPDGLGTARVVSVRDGPVVYVRSSQISSELPGGRNWIKSTTWLGSRSELAALSGNSSATGLEALQAFGGESESLGEEKIDGAITEHYRGSITTAEFAATLREKGKAKLARAYERIARRYPGATELEAWVWPDGIARRFRVAMSIPLAPGGPELKMDMRFQLEELGIDPKIPLPKPSRVLDTTAIARAEAGLLDGSRELRRTKVAAARPLGAKRLRARGNAICRGLQRDLDRQVARAGDAARALGGIDGDSSREEVERALRAYGNELAQPLLRPARQSLRRLALLGPPPRLAGRYRRFLRSYAGAIEGLEALTRTAQLGDVSSWKAVEAAGDKLSEANDADAKALGLTECIGDGESSGSRSAAGATLS